MLSSVRKTPFELLVFLCGALIAASGSSAQADVRWSTDIESSLKLANAHQKLVLMKFTATWCGPCRKMEKETFGNPQVAQIVNQNFVPVLVDADKHKDLVKHLQVEGFPSLLIVSPEMVILHRETGYKTAEELGPKLTAMLLQHRSAAASHFTPAAPVSHTASLPVQSAPQFPGITQPAVTRQARAAAARSVSRAVTQPVTQTLKPSFDGLCLPSVFQSRSLVKGHPNFAVKYRGKILFFHDAEQLKEFKANPSKYWPSRDGICPVTLAEEGRRIEGKLEYAAMFRNQLWLSSTPEKMQKFVTLPARFVDSLPK